MPSWTRGPAGRTSPPPARESPRPGGSASTWRAPRRPRRRSGASVGRPNASSGSSGGSGTRGSPAPWTSSRASGGRRSSSIRRSESSASTYGRRPPCRSSPSRPGSSSSARSARRSPTPTPTTLSERARSTLAGLRSAHRWATADTTTLVHDDRGVARWWTFAGWRANLSLAQLVAGVRKETAAVDDLSIAVDRTTTLPDLHAALTAAPAGPVRLPAAVTAGAADGLKFGECLPPHLATEVVTRRLTDDDSVKTTVAERLAAWRAP